MLHKEVTDRIICGFYRVYNRLGYGFLEKVYENALLIELKRHDLHVQQQHPVQVFYDGECVGDYYADLVVENLVMLELKVADTLHPEHSAQVINYLKATDIEVALLLNFGPKPEIKRLVLTNDRKPLAAPSNKDQIIDQSFD